MALSLVLVSGGCIDTAGTDDGAQDGVSTSTAAPSEDSSTAVVPSTATGEPDTRPMPFARVGTPRRLRVCLHAVASSAALVSDRSTQRSPGNRRIESALGFDVRRVEGRFDSGGDPGGFPFRDCRA